MADLGSRSERDFQSSESCTETSVDGRKQCGGVPRPNNVVTWNPALGLGDCTSHMKNTTTGPQAVCQMNGQNDRNNHGWRRVVRNFTPSWFTVTMGTGIVSVLLYNFPYQATWLYWLSVIVFCLNVALFSAASIISIIRYTLWPEIWSVMIHHPNQALFVGAVPMGLSTIVNMIIFVCVPAWGEWAVYMAFGFWIIDVLLSLASAMYMPFLLIKQERDTQLSSITALQLFPVVATIVASASAGVVAEALPNPQHSLATVIVGYVLWGVGVPTAMVILVVYFHRLALHKMPPREVIVSGFLPLGPLNMGAFSIMQLGSVAMKVFPETKTIHPMAGDILYNIGVFCALIMWGFSLLWFFIAVASIYHCKSFPFNMGWWGFTFPIGTFALSSNKLALELPSRFFRVIGSITSVCVFILWLLVAGATVRDVISGRSKLLDAPCLKDLEVRKESTHSNTSAEKQA